MILIALDLAAAFLGTAGWIGVAVATATRRTWLARALVALALVATLARIATTAGLAAAGWWFVQEKVTLTLPLALAGGIFAVVQLRAGRAVPGALIGGYAAAAGLIFPLLIGYPATWSAALVTVALVSAAALITWRAAVTPPPRTAVAGVTAVGLVGAGLAFLGGPSHASETGRPITELRGPTTPAPGGVVRRFTLTAQEATIRLASGTEVAAWTFNGQSPGPALTATEGDLIEVTLRNADIADGVTLHWHGYDVANAEDGAAGVTQDEVRPGQEHVYRFRADQVGTYWYHTHQVSDPAVRKGLFGTLVVGPSTGLDLTLPVHTFSGTLAVGNHDGVDNRQVAGGTPVRLRLINTDSVPRRFALAGTAYRVVAVDGNDLNRPGELTEAGLRVPAGGRYDLAFTAPSTPVALLVGDDVRVTFNGASRPDSADWPELDLTTYGEPAPTPYDRSTYVDKSVTLVLDRGVALAGGRPKYAQTVNGQAYPSTDTPVVREGDLVRFTVVNRSLETHPWHLHGHRVLVLAKDGRAPTGSPLLLDTFDVRPGEVWEVGFRADNPGYWMNHCHNLSHAQQGMVTHLAYAGFSTPFHGGTAH
ncbi:multicopper oxidase family protein [Actinomycetes bacterium KLBMP 9797]